MPSEVHHVNFVGGGAVAPEAFGEAILRVMTERRIEIKRVGGGQVIGFVPYESARKSNLNVAVIGAESDLAPSGLKPDEINAGLVVRR